jgi:2-succinyl-5-enolpyruvyl-6-hydroxy-3-cyclohexene-1-carboxylate synthase
MSPETTTPSDTPPEAVAQVLLRAFVDELARCGMRAACTSPGSRCTPLLLALTRDPRLRCYSHIDERCAGFFALGLAKAQGLPVAVACTSGTAAAELLPAAVEAHEARVPLILLTADRPAELRDSGAGQTIDQFKLYGDFAKWFFEVDLHHAHEDRLRWIRTLACRAWARSLDGRPGVVHLNFPLREPLVSEAPLPEDPTGRPDGRPYVHRTPGMLHASEAIGELEELIKRARRGIVVAGRHERPAPPTPPRQPPAPTLGQTAASFAAAAGWPLLADPLSGARRGNAAIAHYDALLRDPAFCESLKPDLVIRIGDLPTSKPLRTWLAGLGDVPQAILDPEDAWQDPNNVLCASLPLEPAAALATLAQSVPYAERDWLGGWRTADERAAEAILGVLAAGELCEPTVACELGVLLPAEAILFVASSMPVRDIESFWPLRDDPPRVLCNRGANGIDGTVSSAFGAAAAGSLGGAGDGPTVLLIGDVALAHDLGGLLAAERLGLALTIVLIDNRGGGIFDFLPVGSSPSARELDPHSALDAYTQHVATPTGLDFAHAARLYGLDHERVEDTPAFRAALERALLEQARGRSSIVEVQTERAENVELHRRLWEAVSGAIGAG